jgi:pyrroline-5-carboxylate reductase
MATSIISGLLYSNYCIPEEIMVAVRSPDSPKTTRLRYEEAKPPPWRGGGPPPSSPPTLHLYFLPVPYHHRDLGVTIVDDATNPTTVDELTSKCDHLILATKPAAVPGVCRSLARRLDPSRHVVTSVAAGVTLAQLADNLPPNTHIVRAMPNTPCQVRRGVISLTSGSQASPTDIEALEALFGCVGRTFVVDESAIHGVIAVAGSAPAYMYLVIEALADAGVRAGLPRKVALEMAAMSAVGAGSMVHELGIHPGILKDEVCSPGGTTIAGVAMAEKAGLRGVMLSTAEAVVARSREMSEED